MNLRLLVDENSEGQLFLQLLRKAGCDVISIGGLKEKGLSDDSVLEIAIRENRVIYTKDLDFLRMHKTNQRHPGIIFEYQNNDPNDMNYAEVVAALASLEAINPNLAGGLWVINNFRKRSNLES